MPKTLDTQGFSGLREEVVRPQGCTSCSSVLQALSLYIGFFKEHPLYVGALFRAVQPALNQFPPRSIAASGRS